MTLSLFGTDGVRGRVGVEPITPYTILKLGWAIGKYLRNTGQLGNVLIGKDTRLSGYMLESVLEAGLCSAGTDIVLLGPLPTPGIAHLTHTTNAGAGIVISGSHNPYYDNGIKIFSASGDKMNDESLFAIEKIMNESLDCVEAAGLGKASRKDDAREHYIQYCKDTIDSKISLKGLHLVVDCANGAAYDVAPQVFSELGANVTVMHADPDGYNINQECGSTDMRSLQSRVRKEGADLGIAFDGDADRMLMVDELGSEVNGDQLLYILACHRKRIGKHVAGVVGTTLSNLGLEESLQEMGISFVRSQVGDRFVQEKMIEKGWDLGGETSGHIICFDKSTTGDGMVSALEVLVSMRETAQRLSQLASSMKSYPQYAVNIPIKSPQICAIEQHPSVKKAVLETKEKLGLSGRVVLRPSGTEPLFRVLLEGGNRKQLESLTDNLVNVIHEVASE
ncbi:MAG: phosphoglucosamine mutase [Gammaproteobacteria bacterium]|nr:phosphoglucosamine mutase [Gammaproteobacteria bacterium]MCY4217957.1 phosphoglucosamine mutase [Gammaproteobacteria bacterium]MCY4276132.1 phosphoglucosamine mutase [Gammaproteobacteria bacterium]